ncbi:MAG: methylated-DNA--[protein]-cysteine S-methyltransferase [Rhizobiaceae bacterium]
MISQTITAEAPSPFGPLSLTEKDGAIVAVGWESPENPQTSPLLEEASRQLAAYFAAELKTFDLPLAPKGDAFQQSVCELMLGIPYGETTTYGAIADKLETYGQLVGQACGGNSIPIIIPCHRVLAVDGIGGYSGDGGVERKIELLKLEGGFPYLL